MLPTRVAACWLCALAFWLWPSLLLAQSSAGNKAAAEALFDEGRTLMQQQQYDKACGKLEASQNLDAGLGTLMLLSDCYEKTGKTASAWATFKEAAAAARSQSDTERESVARARAAALEPNLAKLVVRGEKTTLELAGLAISMNGQQVAKAQWGTLIPVDPGVVAFEVTAPGYKSWTLEAQVVPGPSETAIDIPELQPLDPELDTAASGEAASLSRDDSAGAQLAAMETTGEGDAQLRMVGLGLGIGGILAAGVGGYFGLRAKSKNDESKEHCEPDTQCFDEGVDLREDAKSAATVSTIAFGLAGALLVAGGVIYISSADDTGNTSASRKRGPELRWTSGVQPGGAHLGLEGTW